MTGFEFHIKRDIVAFLWRYREVPVIPVTISRGRHMLSWTWVGEGQVRKSALISDLRKVTGFADRSDTGNVTKREDKDDFGFLVLFISQIFNSNSVFRSLIFPLQGKQAQRLHPAYTPCSSSIKKMMDRVHLLPRNKSSLYLIHLRNCSWTVTLIYILHVMLTSSISACVNGHINVFTRVKVAWRQEGLLIFPPMFCIAR